jgi:hypothetical protein
MESVKIKEVSYVSGQDWTEIAEMISTGGILILSEMNE